MNRKLYDTRINLIITKEQYDKITKIAMDRKTTLSQLIREYIDSL